MAQMHKVLAALGGQLVLQDAGSGWAMKHTELSASLRATPRPGQVDKSVVGKAPIASRGTGKVSSSSMAKVAQKALSSSPTSRKAPAKSLAGSVLSQTSRQIKGSW
jgi:hypothetical protein